MQLKAPQRGGLFSRDGALRSTRLLLMGAAAVLLVGVGAWLRGTGLYSDARAWLQRTVASAPNLLEGMLSQPRILTIDVKHKHLLKLGAKRDEALDAGYLFARADDFVPAAISLSEPDGTEVGPIDAKIRLKGDVVDPNERFKWPFRVGIRGDNTLLGMKRFSLHHPKARNWFGEWLYHQALLHEDIIALRYQFVSVVLNGKDLGIFALEEHFEKRLIEHNRRREGPIVRFNEDLFWREMVQQSLPFPESEPNRAGTPSASEVDTFQTSTVLADPERRKQFLVAAGRLDRFRRGELATSEVFDIDRLARYFAVTDLFGAEHGARWHNTRFYYNPVTSLLEPIGFDGDSGQPCKTICGLIEGTWVGREEPPPIDAHFARLFSDRAFFEVYVRELQRIAEPSYATSLMEGLAAEIHDNLAILHKEFPAYSFDTQVFARNQRYIQSVLEPVRAMTAHVRVVGDRVLELELGAIQGMPVLVHGLVQKGATVVQLEQPFLLPGRSPGASPSRHTVRVELPSDLEPTADALAALQVDHSLLGVATRRTTDLLPWPSAVQSSDVQVTLPTGPPLSEFPFLVVDDEAKEVLIMRGEHVVDRDLVVPEGYALTCTEGTLLDLVDSAMILARGPVRWTAARDQPVVLESTDGTGQGLVVMNAGSRSVLSGVVFSGLTAPSRPGWSLTGAVSFHESPVTLDRCRFEKIRCEDAFNAIRSPFFLDQVVFVDIQSDALDGDFCPKSSMVGCVFHDIGNDAVDVSGTVLEIQDLEVVRAGDKAVSAGENSDVTVRGLRVEDSEIGVASKDLSSVLLYEPQIVRCRIGFAAYRKKPEFGSSSIVAHGATWPGTERPFLIEKGSSMMHGSRVIPADQTNVEGMLYGVEYGKASK